MLIARTARKISELPPEDWNAVFPATPEGYDLYKTMDESGFDGFSFYYILVYDDGKPVGAAPCFLMDYALDTTIPSSSGVLAFLKRVSLGSIRIKMLMCGFALGEGKLGIAANRGQEALSVITEAMEKIAIKENASVIVFKDFPEPYASGLDCLLQRGFSKFHGFPAACMDIRYQSFDDYLAKLRVGLRRDLKAKLNKIDRNPKVDFRVASRLDGQLERAYELYLNTYEKSSLHFELVPKSFFEKVSENLPGRVKYFLWSLDDKLVAFNLCLAEDGVLADEYVGFDYDLARRHYLYFLRFRDIMKWCIENGIKKYSLGATGYETKSRLGATFKPVYTYVKHRNKLLHPAIRLACKFIDPTNFDSSMKPGKEEADEE